MPIYITPQDFGVCTPHRLADPYENLLKCVGLVDRQIDNRKDNFAKKLRDDTFKYTSGA